jgi:DNA gyrase subunit A
MEFFTFKEGIARAYGLYAMSVIKGRALPNLNDGLKPVQRRILYAMYEMGNRHNKPFKKAARIVGDTLGKYHPHGDSSIYDALVHMSQWFVMSAPLVEGQGNFGSIDGDRAAAQRYTQVRLHEIAEYLLSDYEKNTVPMKSNYDESLTIPEVLPAQFPNLLVNGASGIAVGMATSIPPHNLGEVMDAVIYALDHEEASLEDLMQFIKGPDFPTEGEFFGGADLKKGYETGRGRVILRGVIVEETKHHRESLIIKSIPYQVTKPKIIEKIADLINEGTLSDISEIRDESSEEIRVVLELKKNANIEVIKQRLFGLTPLQSSFSLNMVAIHDDQPHLFSLTRIIELFLRFREDVVVKRAQYILEKLILKIHIVWGLALATQKMDRIIATIRASENVKDAEKNLMAIDWHQEEFEFVLDILGTTMIPHALYNFSLEQVRGILELRLQKLTKLEKDNLIEELKELHGAFQEQDRIIADREYRKDLMKREFLLIKEKFAVPRRTIPLAFLGDFSEESLIERKDIVMMTTASGYIKRVDLEEYKVQHRNGKGKIGVKKPDDAVTNLFIMNTLTPVLFFTSLGKVFSLKAYEVPEGSLTSKGRASVNLFKLEENEKINTILPLDNTTEDGFLFFVTKKGTVRRNELSDFQNIRANGKIAMKIEADNALHSVFFVKESDDVLLTSSKGNAIRFNVSDVRCFKSRDSEGIKGMELNADDAIVGATIVTPNSKAQILCVTRNGFGKRSDFDEYRRIRRGGKGSKAMNVNSKTGNIIDALYIEHGDEVLLMSQLGQVIRVKTDGIRETARVTSGVGLIKLSKGDLLTQAIRISTADEEVEISQENS